MTLSKKIEKIIDTYGETVSITQNSQTTTSKAFIQSQKIHNNKQHFDFGEFFACGYNDGEEFLYIGLPSFDITAYPINTVLTAQSGTYIIKKATKAYLAGVAVYICAGLEKNVV